MFKTDAVNGRLTPVTARRTAARTAGSASFARLLDQTTSTADAADVAPASPVAGLVGLLDLQEVSGDPGERRRRAFSHGMDLLDRLERLRLDLLAGVIPLGRLSSLLQLVRQHRESCGDVRLDAVLSEIELRAEVELAKLSDNP